MPAAGVRRRDVVPPASERGGLVRRLVALGLRGEELASVVRAGLTRGEIAAALVERLRGG